VVGGTLKNAREGEGELEAGDVAVTFDGVDALAGDANGVGELFLCPAAGCAEFLNAICDGVRHVKLTFHIE